MNNFENVSASTLEDAKQKGLDPEGCNGCESLWHNPCCKQFICLEEARFGDETCNALRKLTEN